MPRSALILALTFALAACSDEPNLEAAVSDRARAADYPALQPLATLLFRTPPAGTAAGFAGTLPARAAALRARARALRGHPVIDAATRARMQAVVNRYN